MNYKPENFNVATHLHTVGVTPHTPNASDSRFSSAASFDFIECEFTRKMVASACMALNENDWKYLRYYYMADGDGYMFSNNRQILDIMYKVQDAYGGGHSGSSIGLTMRIVDRIAKRGLVEYQKQYMAEQSKFSKKTDEGRKAAVLSNKQSDDEIRMRHLDATSDEDYIFYES